jgi:hypothetical protein
MAMTVNGSFYNDEEAELEFVGAVVRAAAMIISEIDSVEEGTTSDASLRATGQKVGVLTKSILAELQNR